MTEAGAEADVAEVEEVTEADVEAAEGEALAFEQLAFDLHACLCTRLRLPAPSCRAGLQNNAPAMHICQEFP